MRTVIITGAGHRPGIGHSVAVLCINQGLKVCVNSRSFDPDVLDFYKANDCVIVPGDITDHAVQEKIIRSCVDQWGRIDYLVNNASTGRADRDDQGNITRQCWVDNFVLNSVVPWEISIRARPYLSDTKGAIVNISSRAALQPGLGNNTAYAVSKAAQNNVTQQLALTLAPDIIVNSVCPGFVVSQRLMEILGDKFDAKVQTYKDTSLMGTPIDLSDVANTVFHLFTNRSMVGQTISICGGTTIQPVGMITIAPGQTC